MLPNAFPAFNQSNLPTFVKSGTHGSLYVLILDESGSMQNVHEDTIGGVNALIKTQKDDPIKSDMRIVKFEGGRISTIRNGNIDSIADITAKDYTPNGGTNLLDAVGETIESVNSYLSSFKDDKRPSVIFQITTDGQENLSRKYDFAKIKQLISLATDAGWLFTFVGAGVDSFSIAGSMGINAAGVSNFTKGKMNETFVAMGKSATRTRSMMATGTSNHELYAMAAVYTADEKKDMEE